MTTPELRKRPPPPELCKLRFRCSKSWDALEDIGQQDVRHCEACKKDVFKVTSMRQRDVARFFHRCVAITGLDDVVYMVGNPPCLEDEVRLPTTFRMDVRLQAQVSAERLQVLARDFPVLFGHPGTAELLLQGQAARFEDLYAEFLDDLVTEMAGRAPELRVEITQTDGATAR